MTRACRIRFELLPTLTYLPLTKRTLNNMVRALNACLFFYAPERCGRDMVEQA